MRNQAEERWRTRLEEAGHTGCSLRGTTTPPSRPQALPEAGRAAGLGRSCWEAEAPPCCPGWDAPEHPNIPAEPSPCCCRARGSSLWKSHSLQLPSRIISIKGKLFSSSLEESCIPVAAAGGTSFPSRRNELPTRRHPHSKCHRGQGGQGRALL